MTIFDMLLLLLGGGTLGAIVGPLITKLLSRRRDGADTTKVEAEAIQVYQAATKAAQEAIGAADEQVDQARKRTDDLYHILQAMRSETDAKIAEVRAEHAAELVSLRSRNEQLTAAVESMARQLDQRTVDQAEVEWARLRNVEYEAMKAELIQLRKDVEQVPHLRAEVARLTVLLEDTQREQRLDHEALRDSLGGTDIG